MELKEIITKIDLLKAELDAYGPLPKDSMEKLEQKIRMEWNYHSNVMEGNSLDYGETRSLLLWGITARGKPLKDHLDLEGHNEAIKKLEAIAKKDVDITENLIKEFHKLILAEPFDRYRTDIDVGKYKRRGNYLYNERNERVDFCPPEEVAEKLNALINWTNNAISPPKRKKKEYDTHPLLIAARFHVEFIAIHPFDDGNGRLARIFMNLILMQRGYPPIIIPLKDREQYYRRLEESREQGVEPLAEYLGERLIASLELYLKAAKGESIEEPDDLDKEIALLKKKIQASDQEVIKSEKLLIALWEDSLKILLTRLIDLVEKFKSLFQRIDIKIDSTFGTNWQSFKNAKEFQDWINNGNELLNINKLSIGANLLNMGRFGIDVNLSVDITFTTVDYKISGNRAQEIIKSYNSTLTDDEIEEYVKDCSKSIIHEINSISDKNKIKEK